MGKYEGIRIMEEEHRTLAAVLHALEHLAKPENFAGTDAKVFWAIIHYLDKYSEKLHHPAEDKYLFTVLKAKSSEANELIEILEDDHAKGDQRIEQLSNALQFAETGKTDSIQDFRAAVDRYAQFYWRHMMQEEKMIFPLATAVFDENDWERLEKGFALNKDPIAGGDVARSMDALLHQIVEIAPPPVGYGK